MPKKRVVVSIGHKDLGTTFPEQKKAIAKTSEVLAEIVQDGWQLAIVHSNAPQVGMIHTAMNEFAKIHDGYTNAPMSVCSAMSQGYIGYDLQNTLHSTLLSRGIYKTVSTLLTQVTVNPYDDAFYTPVKIIGRIMSLEDAKLEEEKGNSIIEIKGRGFRRIVASPNPVAIVEIDAIKALLDADHVVIACGGGGIPVIKQGGQLKGASAVIEKDLAGGLLAREIDADLFLILTSVEHVSLNYGTSDEQPVYNITAKKAEKFLQEGHFESASMLPKIRAGIDFINSGKNRRTIITSIDKYREALKGKAGTVIS
ncbi:hypothetical protein HMPREF9333_00114 [Johnsonella ignava ATCC 51276]|uniref:Carbamate kinase n=1 Tax=Johnsonella ignava ATCC 51276 TaxID=679200 RepID=G5GEX6_9FIRM|nr:carbamate kinase [Johnsonella ignava]EHI56667.1 hypothetical protein HMPREF9333_00114 [Johnsonella ignava ATCC 51276]